MNLKVFEKKGVYEEPIYLSLMEHENGISVVVCNEDGKAQEGGYLLLITSNGTLFRDPLVNKKWGFQLDKQGRIKLEMGG